MRSCKLEWRHDPDEAGDTEALNTDEHSLQWKWPSKALVVLTFPSPSEEVNSALLEETVVCFHLKQLQEMLILFRTHSHYPSVF